MIISNNVKELFSRKSFFVLVSLSFLFFQLIYGFLYPAVGSAEGSWNSISTLAPRFIDSSSGDSFFGKIYSLIPKYNLHNDGTYYLELGRYFSAKDFKGHGFLERPLLPFLIFLASSFAGFFIAVSYPLLFGLAILINLILMGAAVLLFFLLLKELFSLKVAWLSSILLIFSPFVRSFLNQPSAEILMIFAVVLILYLLRDYVKKPSILKLLVFSLIASLFMLSKMFFAISFFILLLAIYFKRCKEGIIFLIIQPLPLLFWYFWVTRIWQIPYFSLGIQRYKMGVWVFDIFHLPWQTTYRIFLSALPDFITALIYGFLLIPLVFSVIGFQKLPFKSKNIIYFGSIFSFLAFLFLVTIYSFRHVFLLFPIIYPTAVLGMESTADLLKKYKTWAAPLFYAVVIGFIILISNINIYQIFDYNQSA